MAGNEESKIISKVSVDLKIMQRLFCNHPFFFLTSLFISFLPLILSLTLQGRSLYLPIFTPKNHCYYSSQKESVLVIVTLLKSSVPKDSFFFVIMPRHFSSLLYYLFYHTPYIALSTSIIKPY